MAEDDQDNSEEEALLGSSKRTPESQDIQGQRDESGGVIGAAITLLCIAAYLFTGPALILTNKKLLKDAGFGYPMMVSGLGQASSAVGAVLYFKVLRLQQLEHTNLTWPFYLRNMMAVGGATAASLCFGNAGYMYLTVSFVQILKAFTPVFVVAMLGLTGIEVPSRKVVLSVLMISTGTAIASAGEANFNATGLVIMFCAETCEATRLVLTQKLLNNLRFGALEGLYWMAPICTLWMWALAAVWELPAALRRDAFAPLRGAYAPTVASAACLGFSVNMASFLVIKRTSSTMLKLLGTVRNAGLVLFSAVFLGELITVTQAIGYVICLASFGLYSAVKAGRL